MIDKQGTATFSKPLVVRVYRTKSLQSVSVTPNPTINDIKVKVQLNEDAFIVMKVMDKSGNSLIRKTAKGNIGGNNFNLDGTSHLQTGTYLMEVVINSNERMMLTLVKN
jgi:hypothetical protein